MQSSFSKRFLALITFLFSSFLFAAGQDNPYELGCPHSATFGIGTNGQAKGLIPFYTANRQTVSSTGRTTSRLGEDWAFIKIKNEGIPAMDERGTLHYNNPFDASFLLYYKGDNNIEKTWWFHENNNPSKPIRTYYESLVEMYQRERNFTLNLRDNISSELKAKKFVVAEYTGTINRNKPDFIFTNTLFIKSGLVNSSAEYQRILNFYSGFLGKFENFNFDILSNRVYITTVKGANSNYVAIFKVQDGKLIGELQKVDNVTKPQVISTIKREISAIKDDGAAYVYGDNLFGLSKNISDAASENNVLLISRNTAIKKSFNQTEATLEKLKDKRLDKSSVSYFNGFPKTAEEAKFQDIDFDVEGLQKAVADIDTRATTKASKTITSKDELIKELTEGENDLLFIIAHCDEKNMYFGNSKISLEEISSLPIRHDRNKERIAVLFSCMTGKIYEKQKAFLPFFKKNMQSFSETLIEKNYFDLIISPPTTITVGETLNMIEALDKHNVLELRKHFNTLTSGEIINIVKITTSNEKFFN